jgi:hypothetical protein
MRLNQLTSYAIHQLVGRLLWRLLAGALIGLLVLIALYHFTVAGTLALETQVGVLYAQLIVAGAFSAAALIVLGVLVATRARPALKASAAGSVLSEPRNIQIAMLVEAVMLGYTLARKQPR